MQRSFFNILGISQKILRVNCVRYSSDLFRHKVNSESFKDTFQFWIISKFRTDDKYTSLQITNSVINNQDCSCLEYESLLNLWLRTKYSRDSVLRYQIKSELLRRIKSGSLEDIFMTLDASISYYEHRLKSENIYKVCLSRLEYLTDNSMSIYHRLQGLYYCSFIKKSNKFEKLMIKLLGSLYKDAQYLNNVELSILCVSLYKSSFKANEVLSNIIVDRLKNQIEWFINNPSFMICLIKSLRHSQTYDDNLFILLSEHFESIKKIDLISKIHLLVYLCDSLYLDNDFILKFIKHLVSELQNKYVGSGVRFKDINNLLWSSSNYWNTDLSRHMNENNLAEIVKKIIKNENVQSNEIFNVLLYIQILNVRDIDLLKYITKDNILTVRKVNNFKDLYRLSLLLTLMSIEDSKSFDNELLNFRELRLQPSHSKYLMKRPKLNILLKEILKNKERLKLQNVEFNFKVPCLYIGGINVELNSKCISIELCDEVTSYRGSNEPHGYMRLKLRLLQWLGIDYYLIKEDINADSLNMIINKIESWLQALR